MIFSLTGVLYKAAKIQKTEQFDVLVLADYYSENIVIFAAQFHLKDKPR